MSPKLNAAAATQAWVDAFNSHDRERIVALYDPEAVLWGTRSTELAYDRDSIRRYYTDLPPSIRVVLGEHHLRVYSDMAIDTGYYTVSYMRENRPVVVPARFSFTYRLRKDRWMIMDHHSSLLPTRTSP
jgi:hypothetical protein